MNNFGIKQIGIQKCQTGTPRGGLVNHQNSGTWGDRGQGNELQSALENGLSWAADKVMNFGDYVDQGLSYVTGLLPGGQTSEEAVQDTKLSQSARNAGEPGYMNTYREYQMFPMTGMPPALPALPKNASPELTDMYNGLVKQWRSYSARESQMKKDGILDKLKSTRTVKRYEEKEKAFNNAVEEFKANQPHLKKMKNDVVLTRKQNVSFKRNKAAATGDGRATNSGRSRVTEAQWREVEKDLHHDVERADRRAEQILLKYVKKETKGAMSKEQLREAKKEMLLEYMKTKPGFYDYLLKKRE